MDKKILDFEPMPNFQTWILVWAFAESAIGGIMHALKIPFTGLIVGSVSVMCIAMIAHFYPDKPQKIIQALGVVLLIKLTLSPYSPWQAYVAVFFQGYLGYFLYRSHSHFQLKTLVFAMLSLIESALQKVILSILIFGNSLISAVDQSAQQVLYTLGLDYESSFIYTVFVFYIILYGIVGLILGFWIPKIPGQIYIIKSQLDTLEFEQITEIPSKKQVIKKWVFGLSILLGLTLFIKLIFPAFPLVKLILFLGRSILVSLLIVFIVGPIIMRLVKKWMSKQSVDTTLFSHTLGYIPDFSRKALILFNAINQKYQWQNKVQYFVIGLIYLSMKENQQI